MCLRKAFWLSGMHQAYGLKLVLIPKEQKTEVRESCLHVVMVTFIRGLPSILYQLLNADAKDIKSSSYTRAVGNLV